MERVFGYVKPEGLRAVAGVANVGDDDNWCGHDFAQANWYAFGRLAWNPHLSSAEIADEWLKQTFSSDKTFVDAMGEVMLESREAVVDYMMPLGLHHIFAWGHHYGPEPWCKVDGARPDWLPSYYHRADSKGLGFDRSYTGSNAVEQYPDSLANVFGSQNTCPEEFLLWFHHVPWTYKLKMDIPCGKNSVTSTMTDWKLCGVSGKHGQACVRMSIKNATKRYPDVWIFRLMMLYGGRMPVCCIFRLIRR